MKNVPRFTITITHYHWSCGDGCCSDSGYKMYVEDHQPEVKGYGCVTEDGDWNMNRWAPGLIERSVKAISKKLNRDAVKGLDFNLIEDEKYSDDDYEED